MSVISILKIWRFHATKKYWKIFSEVLKNTNKEAASLYDQHKEFIAKDYAWVLINGLHEYCKKSNVDINKLIQEFNKTQTGKRGFQKPRKLYDPEVDSSLSSLRDSEGRGESEGFDPSLYYDDENEVTKRIVEEHGRK